MTINSSAAIAACDVSRRRPRSSGCRAASSAGRSRTTSSRSTSPRRSTSSRRGRRCGSSRTCSSSARRRCRTGTRSPYRGYHIREAGSTAAQELAFTLADGIAYVEAALERGLDVDDFAPAALVLLQRPHRLLRGDRKIPCGAPDLGARDAGALRREETERSWLLRFHTQTAGVSLTAQQPLNNVVRTAIEALAAVLGGTQSLHTNSFDEALALPTEDAVQLALRTQQIIAYETGVANTIDPLGGSYAVEALTNRIEAEAYELFGRIDELGGMVAAIEQGMPAARDRRGRVPLPAGGRGGGADRRRRQPLPHDRRGGAQHPPDRPRPRAEADRAAAGLQGATRLGRRRASHRRARRDRFGTGAQSHAR